MKKLVTLGQENPSTDEGGRWCVWGTGSFSSPSLAGRLQSMSKAKKNSKWKRPHFYPPSKKHGSVQPLSLFVKYFTVFPAGINLHFHDLWLSLV